MNAFVHDAVFPLVDELIVRIQQHKIEPHFSAEVTRRENNVARPFTSENEIFDAYAQVISLSNGSKSELVETIIKNGKLAAAIHSYDVEKMAQANPCDLIDASWADLGAALRRKSKLLQLTLAARAIVRSGGLMKVFNQAQLPIRVQSVADIDQFWKGLNLLRLKMVELDMPYLKAHTSLLHFLLHTGYDCGKPDSAVMGVASKWGMARGKTPKAQENDLLAVVRMMQEYGVARGIRPPLIDFYMLIEGHQSWASKHVKASYYQGRSLRPTANDTRAEDVSA